MCAERQLQHRIHRRRAAAAFGYDSSGQSAFHCFRLRAIGGGGQLSAYSHGELQWGGVYLCGEFYAAGMLRVRRVLRDDLAAYTGHHELALHVRRYDGRDLRSGLLPAGSGNVPMCGYAMPRQSNHSVGVERPGRDGDSERSTHFSNKLPALTRPGLVCAAGYLYAYLHRAMRRADLRSLCIVFGVGGVFDTE